MTRQDEAELEEESAIDTQTRLLEDYADLRIKEDREKRKSPYKEFVQFNKHQMQELLKLQRKSSLAYSVLWFLIEHCNNYNCVIVSQVSLGKIFGRTSTSIYNAIRILKEHNYIQVKKNGQSNVYMVNSRIAWKSYGSNHKFAEFSAKIIWSKEEIENMGLQLDKISAEYGQNMICSE